MSFCKIIKILSLLRKFKFLENIKTLLLRTVTECFRSVEGGRDFVLRRSAYMDLTRSFYDNNLTEAERDELINTHCSNSGKNYYDSLMTHNIHPVYDHPVIDAKISESLEKWTVKSSLCLEKFCWENINVQNRCQRVRALYLTFTRVLNEVNEMDLADVGEYGVYEFLDLETLIDIYCREHNVDRFTVNDLPLLPSPLSLVTQSETFGKSKIKP